MTHDKTHNKPRNSQDIRIFAHRGSAVVAPENTVPAFDFALQHQADVLETDVRLSRDGHVIVTHDDTLDRTTNGHGPVREHNLVDLKKLDAGYRFIDNDGRSYKNQHIQLLTLHELFQRYPNVGINIDIKDDDPEAVKAVANVVNDYSESHWINVGSFNPNCMRVFRQLAPTISTAATKPEVARLLLGPKQFPPLPYQLLQIPLSYWGIPLARQRFIQKVHDANLEIVHWTINEKDTMLKLFSRHVDGVVTDRADIALNTLQTLGLK